MHKNAFISNLFFKFEFFVPKKFLYGCIKHEIFIFLKLHFPLSKDRQLNHKSLIRLRVLISLKSRIASSRLHVKDGLRAYACFARSTHQKFNIYLIGHFVELIHISCCRCYQLFRYVFIFIKKCHGKYLKCSNEVD